MVFLFAVLYLLIIFDEANFIFGYSLISVELFALWGGEGGEDWECLRLIYRVVLIVSLLNLRSQIEWKLFKSIIYVNT